MALEVLDCDQGSDEWLRARMGLATASNFAKVCASAKDGKERKTRDKYMRQLAGEIVMEEPAKTFRNEAMERGKEHEPELLVQYAYESGNDVERIGFARDLELGAGASPDGLIGKDGMVEFKSMEPDLLIELYSDKDYPTRHRLQLQGNLWIARRKWIDIAIGYIVARPEPLPPKRMPLYRQTVHRDEGVIKMLEIEVREFNEELTHMVKMVRRRM